MHIVLNDNLYSVTRGVFRSQWVTVFSSIVDVRLDSKYATRTFCKTRKLKTPTIVLHGSVCQKSESNYKERMLQKKAAQSVDTSRHLLQN